jgi:hypothetical protein
MSRPPNPYRDEHRKLESEGNAASNRGDYADAARKWREAAALKRKGQQEIDNKESK